MTTASVTVALEFLPHGGSVSHGESLSIAMQGHNRVEHAPHISYPSSGVSSAELRPQGSQPAKILEKTICIQVSAGCPKAFLTEKKVSCLSQVYVSISLGHSLC